MIKYRTAYGIEGTETLSRLILSDGVDAVSGQILVKTKTDSTSPLTGAMVLTGGVGIGGNLNVANELHVLTQNNGTISLGGNFTTNPSQLQINSRLTTDLLPYFDGGVSLGNDTNRIQNIDVNNVTNPGPINIFSTSPDPSVGVSVRNLKLTGPFNVHDPATFQSDVTIYGQTYLKREDAPDTPFLQLEGTASFGSMTDNLVLNDANVNGATIRGFAKVNVTDINGTLMQGPYYVPLYTLTV